MIDGDKVGVDDAIHDQIKKLRWFLVWSRLLGALQNLVALAGGVANGDEVVAAYEKEDISKGQVSVLDRLNIFQDQEEILVRSLGLESLVVAAAVLNVQRMKLELLRQLVELRVIGIIKRVPGHDGLLRSWKIRLPLHIEENMLRLCSG